VNVCPCPPPPPHRIGRAHTIDPDNRSGLSGYIYVSSSPLSHCLCLPVGVWSVSVQKKKPRRNKRTPIINQGRKKDCFSLFFNRKISFCRFLFPTSVRRLGREERKVSFRHLWFWALIWDGYKYLHVVTNVILLQRVHVMSSLYFFFALFPYAE
jgi:hypothetical protein